MHLWHYKDLIYLLIRRDFVTSFKQTILGPVWIIIQALMGSAVFTIIFGNIAGLSTDGHPAFLFYLCGNLAWQYFSNVLGIGTTALQANLHLFSKIYFPRLIPPIAQAISALLNFSIQLLVFLIAVMVYNLNFNISQIDINIEIILLPFIVFQSAILGLGLGFIISAASVKYRDLARISGMFTQFLMYATPVIYPISEIPDKYQALAALNPLTFIVESYRHILLGFSTGCKFEFALPSIILTIIIFLIGLSLYNKTQRTYVDYV